MLGSNAREGVLKRLMADRSGWKYHASSKRCVDVDIDVARASFYRAFGLLPDQQISLEHSLRERVFTDTQIQVSSSPLDKVPLFVTV
jgi:hypothetical protein